MAMTRHFLFVAFLLALVYVARVYTDQHPRLLPLGRPTPHGVAFTIAQAKENGD